MRGSESFAWTDDRIAALSKLWSSGLSAAKIAAELGAPTRNVVVGKIDRLKLPKRAEMAAVVTVGAAPVKERATTTPHAKPALALRPKAVERSKPAPKSGAPTPVPIAPAVAVLAEPVDGGLEIHELRDRSCRWPVGAPGGDELMRYCGARVSEAVRSAGLCYCAAHMAVAYPLKEARKRP